MTSHRLASVYISQASCLESYFTLYWSLGSEVPPSLVICYGGVLTLTILHFCAGEKEEQFRGSKKPVESSSNEQFVLYDSGEGWKTYYCIPSPLC